MRWLTRSKLCALSATLVALGLTAPADANVYTTYLWHMHQPIYWPDASASNPNAYQFAFESLVLKGTGGNTYPMSAAGAHPLNDLDSIFGKDDRVADYQFYPVNALQAAGNHPQMGAQVSFAGALVQNLNSLAGGNWQGGRYPTNWPDAYSQAADWTTASGKPRLDIVNVAFHHPICALLEERVLRMQVRMQQHVAQQTWGGPVSKGFFPAEMCFSTRMIPALVAEGIEWSLVPNSHISRACPDYPFAGNEDNCDPPNRADQINPPGVNFNNLRISRGINTKNAYPMAYRPNWMQYVDPETGAVDQMIAVPAAQGMSWNEGYGPYGTGEIDQIAASGTPNRPLLVVFAHDGDNAYAGGFSYYNQNVPDFCNAAAGQGYTPSTVQHYLDTYSVPQSDLIHVEDGGWVNADGDFGSPQYINWNWPLSDAQGNFDIENGWAEDQRNWAVLTAAQNWAETAEDVSGPVRTDQVIEPNGNSTSAERAWHFYMGGLDSGYMYYGQAIDMEVKPTIAANNAVQHAAAALGATFTDTTPPSVFLPQRHPYNPGGVGAGALWGYQERQMSSDFHIYTFAYDVSGIQSVNLRIREDLDGTNPLSSIQNETFAGGPEVDPWQTIPMQQRVFPKGKVSNSPEIDFFVLPDHIADQYHVELTGYQDVLLDYYVEVIDVHGNVKNTPLQHVYVGTAAPVNRDGVWWEPDTPASNQTVTIRVENATQGANLHWGVNAQGSIWETPDQALWPTGSTLWQGTGPAIESPMSGPDVNGTLSITLGPFGGVSQNVQTIDFVVHYADDTWDNNGGSDYHVQVASGIATPTPALTTTPTPPVTPTPTPPQPTATPTPPPGAPRLLMAGYGSSEIQVGQQGMAQFLALTANPGQGVVEVTYNGLPIGITLMDDGTQGDFAARDGVFGRQVVFTPTAPGRLPFDMVLSDEGWPWPYLRVE